MLINDYGQRVAFSDSVQRVLTREALSCGKSAAAVDFENGAVQGQGHLRQAAGRLLRQAAHVLGNTHRGQLRGAHR